MNKLQSEWISFIAILFAIFQAFFFTSFWISRYSVDLGFIVSMAFIGLLMLFGVFVYLSLIVAGVLLIKSQKSYILPFVVIPFLVLCFYPMGIMYCFVYFQYIFLLALLYISINAKSISPLKIVAIFVLLLACIIQMAPIHMWESKHFLSQNKNKLLNIVELVKKGEINSEEDKMLAELPPGHYGLTGIGKDIMISGDNNNLEVLFYNPGGFLDNYTGIVYSQDDSEPDGYDFKAGQWEVTKLEDNWYYCSSR